MSVRNKRGIKANRREVRTVKKAAADRYRQQLRAERELNDAS